jgi:hypothetical protein
MTFTDKIYQKKPFLKILKAEKLNNPFDKAIFTVTDRIITGK